MKKALLLAFCCFALNAAFCQLDSGNVVLGIAPLGKTSKIDEKYPSQILGVIAEQASNISGLNYVSRSPQVLEQIAKEKNIQTGSDWLNSENLAEAGKRLGANYLVTGDIVQVSVEKAKLGTRKGPFGVEIPITGKFVTIIINMNIVNVVTGTTVTKQISSSSLPAVSLSDEKMVANKIKNMGGDFREFLQNWYSSSKTASR